MSDAVESWLSTRFPPALQSAGGDRIEEWRQASAPPALAWRSLAQLARAGGMLDLAIASIDRGLVDAPDDDGLLADRACLATLVGDDLRARELTQRIAPGTGLRVLPLLDAFEAGTLRDSPELFALLAVIPTWGEAHDRLVKACRQAGRAGEGAGFVAQWLGRHGAAAAALARAGEALLEADLPEQAHQVLTPLWQAFGAQLEPMVGRRDAPPVAPGQMIARIEQGLARPANAPFALPGADLRPDSARVLMIGSETSGGREVFPNDLAAHFQATAAAAGGRLDLYLDDALGKPMEVRMPDHAVAHRVAALGAHLDASRPDIVVLDCAWSPTGRGLDRAILGQWRRQFNFRLVVLFRDALKSAVSLIEYWAEIADGVLIFDPHSPAMTALPGRCTAIPVPALHPPFAPGANDHGLLFIGGLSTLRRVMLLTALKHQPIGLKLLVGNERLRRTATPADYAACLAQASATLNIAAHDIAECLVTGRVWEAIACGTTLLEQAGSGTEAFFTPWRHYLPWSNMAEIVALSLALEDRDDLRQAISAEALAFAREHYNSDKVWRAVLAAAEA